MLRVDLMKGGEVSLGGVLCQVCLKYSTECILRRCSGCKLALYCSKEHQKQDWPKHKEFCKSFQTVMKKNGSSHCENHSHNLHLCTNMQICQKILGRKLNCTEADLFHMPYCSFCRRFWDEIVICSNCNGVVYCSEEHRKMHIVKHSEICDELKFYLDMNRTIKNHKAEVSVTIKAEDVFRGDPSYNMGNILEATKVDVTRANLKPYKKYLISDMLSVCGTVLYAMYRCKPLKKMKKTELSIHIVGSSYMESDCGTSWTLFCHYLRRLKILNLVFIGPRISPYEVANPETSEVLLRDQITTSTEPHCQLNKSYKQCLYQDFVKENPNSNPDVIIMFDCGFHVAFYSKDWKNAFLPMCSFPKTVISFTSYNKKESIRDFLICLSRTYMKDLVTVVRHEKNPYRSHYPLIPQVDVVQSFVNNYITILHTK